VRARRPRPGCCARTSRLHLTGLAQEYEINGQTEVITLDYSLDLGTGRPGRTRRAHTRAPKADLSSFLAKAGRTAELQPVEDGLSAGAYLLGFSQYLQGWPSDAEWEGLLTDSTRNLLGQEVSEPGFHRSILVDETDPEIFTVYLVHFEVY